MQLIPWAIVGLLLGALVILWAISKSRIEGLSEDLDWERNENGAMKDALSGEIAELRALKDPPLKPAVQYVPTHRRPWPTPEGMRRGYRAIDTGTDIVDRSVYRRTALDDKVALAKLGMDCATFHFEDCDCVTTCQLFLDLAAEHEAAQAEGA